jgi:putative membrane protein insertion efficiency factor
MTTDHPEKGAAGRRVPLFPRPESLVGWLLLPFTWLSIALIRLYQLAVSPAIPPSCRFAPSCSQYALEAVQRYGAVKGWFLGLRRLARCHPWNPGGFDPVP